MKQVIRRNVFETNSSSTHALCIAQDQDVEVPNSIDCKPGEFGWEVSVLALPEDKLSYVYTAIITDFPQLLDGLVESLNSFGIDVEYQEWDKDDYCYVDHGGGLDEFLHDIIDNPTLLKNFLFSNKSFIVTGNDNDNSSRADIYVDYPHLEYYKGN